jgi:hypothetical protein
VPLARARGGASQEGLVSLLGAERMRSHCVFAVANGACVAGRNATVTKLYLLGHSSSLAQLSRYLRQILGFIGIEDVRTVRAEGTNIPPLAIHAVPNREKAVAALVI